MAPTTPKTRARTRLPQSARPSQTQSFSSFGLDRTSKRDKRTIKHSALLSRIQKSHATSRKKRRRPSKKLVTNLDSLAEALPENENGGRKKRVEATIEHKSLKSKPGSAKKREKEITEQKERFERNLARMMEGKKDSGSEARVDGLGKESGGKSWQALRAFIQQTMAKKDDSGS